MNYFSEIIGKTGNELKIGNKSTFAKTISETDIYNFAGITGDFNYAHINHEHAKNGLFKQRVAHGMLTTSLISGAINHKLPGPGTICIEQEIKFLKPVFINETITVNLEILNIEKNEENNYVILLKSDCFNQKKECVLEGILKVVPPFKN